MKTIWLSWTDLKANIIAKGIIKEEVIWFLQSDRYTVIVIDGPLTLKSSFDADEADGIDFESTYKSATIKRINPKTETTGVQKVAIEKPDDSSTTLISHDWCDPTTWYGESVRTKGASVTLKVGTTDVFETGKTNLIDVKHGKIYGEDGLIETYGIKVFDGLTELVEDEHYSVNYALGEITIKPTYTIQGTLSTDFSEAKGSGFLVEPSSGKILIIEHTELNFSRDAFISSPIDFEIWAGNPYFNPQAPVEEWTPTSQFGVNNFLRFPHKKITYKNEKDIINASNLGQGFIPKFGNLPTDILVFPFNYVTSTVMKSSQLIQLIIRLRYDKDGNQQMKPLTGSYGTVSFYVISQGE